RTGCRGGVFLAQQRGEPQAPSRHGDLLPFFYTRRRHLALARPDVFHKMSAGSIGYSHPQLHKGASDDGQADGRRNAVDER
ncbi:MAG: hypothetical protein KDA99_28470, partial [Planctomycetales bacterium]|nr:hypothetical protein [Planctomycetales bacterium]